MKLIKQILATIASSICGGAVCIEIFELNSLGYTGILDYLSILLIGVYLSIHHYSRHPLFNSYNKHHEIHKFT